MDLLRHLPPGQNEQEPVKFGSAYQLRHVESGKFLVFKNKLPANVQENKQTGKLLKCVDDKKVPFDDEFPFTGDRNFKVRGTIIFISILGPDSTHHLLYTQIKPRFKFRQDGDEVQAGDVIQLTAFPTGEADAEEYAVTATVNPFLAKDDPLLCEAVMATYSPDYTLPSEWEICYYGSIADTTAIVEMEDIPTQIMQTGDSRTAIY